MHVSIPSVWLKWGQKEAHTSKDDVTDKQQSDFAESLESPDDGFTLLDDDALTKVGLKSGLVGMYDKDSQAVAERVKGKYLSLSGVFCPIIVDHSRK